MAVSRLHPAPPPPTQHQQQHHNNQQQQHHHHHHIASTLMSCVRESSPVEELEEATEDSAECGGGGGAGGGGAGGGGGVAEGRKQGRHETKKRRFHPLRGLRRIFRRKSRRSPEDGDRAVLPQSSSAVASTSFGGAGALNSDDHRRNNDSGGPSAAAAAAAYGELDEAYRSRSASELLSGEEEEEDGSPGGSGRRRGSGGIASGEIFQDSLRHSVSHDSVFSSGERRATSNGGGSGGGGGRPSQPLAPSSSAQQVAAHQGVRAELFDAVRRRRWRGRSKDRDDENGEDRETGEASAGAGRSSDDEEDLGLPRSPCNSPSSGEAGLRSDQKEIQSKSHSTCSEGSLLSMGSSDMDEDSQGHFSGHSSKLSLHEKSSSQYGSDLELDIGATAEPLSHSAARHKMSVRPKRTHGAPRLRRLKEVTSLGSLPTTPEVNEDSGRCSSPEISFNQETSSTEHIQVPSDNIKTASMSSAIAVEMSQRVMQSRQNAANSKSNAPPSCSNPESFSLSPKPSIQSILEPPTLDSDKRDTRELDYGGEDAYIQHDKQEMIASQNMSVSCNEVDNGAVEEVVGMEETDSNGTNLLSRILSWRGSKKKIDEPPEGATCAIEGAPPSRRMDVHGRYVHEVICETEVVSGSEVQPPPSPGWRPAPFSTSWPPLIHSTPRSCNASSRYIPPGREELGNNFSEEVTYSEWGTDYSGPHSLPLMMQCDTIEISQEKVNIDRSGVNRQMFTSAAGTFPMNSRTKLPPSQSDAPAELLLSKSSSFKACRQEQQYIFSSSEAPESLPVRFERSEFSTDVTMPSTESLIKVGTSDSDLVEKVEKTSQPQETFLMTSVEGLLTLDVSGTSDVKSAEVTEQKMSESFVTEMGGIDEGPPEEWEEAHRDAEEEILTNSFISVPEDRNVGLVDDMESKVTLQHTKMEPEESSHYQSERKDDFVNMEESFEPPAQKLIESRTSLEDQIVSSDSAVTGSQRTEPVYKRTQSVPASPSVTQTSDVPEFLRVQLIHVDCRPSTNVVLHSTGGVPVSVNPPESNDTPGRRRLRPRSADGLESKDSATKEIVSVTSTVKSRIADVVNVVDNNKAGSSAEVAIKDKELLNNGKGKVSSRDSIGRVSQNEDSKPKEVSLVHTTPQKESDETSDKVSSTAGVAAPSKEEAVDQFHKALSRECSEITIQTEDVKHKDGPISARMQRKMSEDKISGVPVVSMKDKEDVLRYKTPVRESLGTVVVQNNENRSSLPPKAQRKVSDESSAEVVPRRKSTSSKDFGSQNKDDEPELFKVFARRSLKLKDSETWENHPPTQQQQQRSRDSDKENDIGDNIVDVVILPIAKEQKQRESLILRDVVDSPVKPPLVALPADTPQLRCISSNNSILQSPSIGSGNSVVQNSSIYGNDKVTGVASETSRIHRSSVGSYPRREGPSPEKRPRGVSVNLPPESHPFRVEMNRGAAVSSEQRRPLWATQIQTDESYGKALSSENADQPVELGVKVEDDVKPHFKRIQQRKEEWELRARMK